MEEEACKCNEELEDTEERLVGAQVAACKTHNDAKTAREEAITFEVDNGAEVESSRDDIDKWTEQ